MPKASCVAMATGLDCCLVIDSGAHHTTVTAVVDQKVIKGCHTVRQVGGAHISQCLAEVLSDKGLRPEVGPVYVCSHDLSLCLSQAMLNIRIHRST